MGLRWAQKKWDSTLRSSFWRRKRAGAGGGPPRSLAMKSFMVLRFTPRRQREQNQRSRYSPTWGMPSCQRCPSTQPHQRLPQAPEKRKMPRSPGPSSGWEKHILFLVGKRTPLLSPKQTEHREYGVEERTLDLRKKLQSDSQLWFSYLFKPLLDFPRGAVVRNPPPSAGDTGSIPGPGRSHMPRGN